MFYSSRYGYLAFGSDIGGYREDDNYPLSRSKELFIRWTQLGALSPLMENGGGGEHRPWIFDSETEAIYRHFTELHYALVPYLMSEGEEAWAEGVSLMTFFNKSNYSYMLGDDIFVAPITNENSQLQIRFPDDGTWVYLFDRAEVYRGGTYHSLSFPLAEYPVFLRSGSTIESVFE
jgi:alpha-D-xyloside xylohydrolase